MNITIVTNSPGLMRRKGGRNKTSFNKYEGLRI